MRTIVITGASAGVGRATARRFAAPGTSIALLARGRIGLDAVAAEVEASGGHALALDVDVADAGAVRHAARRIEDQLGPIDVWINNAMVTVFGPVSRLTADELTRVTHVTYLGAAFGTMAALEHMRPRDRGVILQVGSALAYRAIPLQAAYCAAKHAVRAFTDSLRCELLHDGSRVRVSCVHLPALDTPQFTWGRSHMRTQAQPVPPIYAPDVAAAALVHAAAHERREFFVGWPTIMAVVGNRFFPGLLDRFLADAAWDGQLTGHPMRAERRDNLMMPVEGDQGACGMFRDRQRPAGWLDRAGARLGAGGVQTMVIAVALLVVSVGAVVLASAW